MVEVDPTIPLVGPHGPVTLLEVFEGRRLLMVYFHMWHTGQPASAQCEGCTFNNSQVRELAYLHSRDVTYATFCEGPYEESIRYHDFLELDAPWYSAQASADALLAGREFGVRHSSRHRLVKPFDIGLRWRRAVGDGRADAMHGGAQRQRLRHVLELRPRRRPSPARPPGSGGC